MDKNEVVAQAADFRKKYNSEGLIPFPFEETIEKIPDLTLSYLNTTNRNFLLKATNTFTIPLFNSV